MCDQKSLTKGDPKKQTGIKNTKEVVVIAAKGKANEEAEIETTRGV